MSEQITDAEILEKLDERRWAWIVDPMLFVEEFLGIGRCKCKSGKPCKLDHNQVKILRDFSKLCLVKLKKYCTDMELDELEALLAEKKGSSTKSGKGVGKTALAAIVGLWFFVCFKMARVVVLGPKYDQIKDNLWPEISKWLNHAVEVFGEDCLANRIMEKQADKIYMKGLPKVALGEKWVIKILTFPKNSSIEDQKAAVQGQHDDNMLFLMDEASGIPDHIFEPVESTLTSTSGVNAAFVIFNPNKNTGWAIETQGKMKSKWLTHRINAENSDLVSKDQISYMRLKYGLDSNKYRISVLGLPPVAEEGALIPWQWMEDAKDRGNDAHESYVEINEDDPVIFGVDIGGGGSGDISCICVRKGWHILEFLKSTTVDTDAVCNWIMRMMDQYQPLMSFIDMNAIGRQSFFKIKGFGYRIFGVNSQSSSVSKDNFYRIRDELYWNVRTGFENGLFVFCPNAKGEYDDDIIDELSLIKYDDQGTEGKTKIISKQNAAYKRDMKSLLGYDSPNMADSLSLTTRFTFESMVNKNKNVNSSRNRAKNSERKSSRSSRWMRG